MKSDYLYDYAAILDRGGREMENGLSKQSKHQPSFRFSRETYSKIRSRFESTQKSIHNTIVQMSKQ